MVDLARFWIRARSASIYIKIAAGLVGIVAAALWY